MNCIHCEYMEYKPDVRRFICNHPKTEESDVSHNILPSFIGWECDIVL